MALFPSLMSGTQNLDREECAPGLRSLSVHRDWCCLKSHDSIAPLLRPPNTETVLLPTGPEVALSLENKRSTTLRILISSKWTPWRQCDFKISEHPKLLHTWVGELGTLLGDTAQHSEVDGVDAPLGFSSPASFQWNLFSFFVAKRWIILSYVMQRGRCTVISSLVFNISWTIGSRNTWRKNSH